MDGAVRTSEPVAGALSLLSAGLVFGAVFFGGDSGDSSVLWVGGSAVLLAAVCLGLRGLGLIGLPTVDGALRVAIAGFAGLVAWTGISIAWSVAGDHSWSALNKGIAYAGFFVVGLALCSLGTRTTRTIASLLATIFGAALAWALLGKAIPSLGPSDLLGVGRLQSPIGYANGLALLADASVALGLWLAVVRRLVPRMSGTLLVYLAVLVLLLTSSRAGVIGAVLVLGLWLWAGRARLEGALVAVGAGVPAAFVAAWAFTRPALVDTGVAHSGRVHDGAIFGVLALLGAGIAVVATLWLPRLVTGREPLAARLLVGLAIVAVVAGAVATASHHFSSGECVNDPGRVGSLCANNRLHWWREAVRIFADRPAGGSGAGTFEIARTPVRRNADFVTEPHSVPLQILAGTGVVGGALLLVFVAAAGLGIVRSLRRLEGEERAAAVALTALPAVYALHALVDFDLDFLALTGPTLLAIGVLLGTGRTLRRGSSFVSQIAVAGIVVAAVVSLGSPWLAARKVDSAKRAIDSGQLAQAVSDANGARSLNPLLPEPLYTLGEAAARAGDLTTARARFRQATRLQPENTSTWYRLGQLEYYGAQDLCAAYTAFNHAYTLDPNGSEWIKGGELDKARDAVNNDHACG
jgi:O-Antigen ligase/Tetratricopeptide repeat